MTVGTEKEVSRFLHEIERVIEEVHSEVGKANGADEEKKENAANSVIS